MTRHVETILTEHLEAGATAEEAVEKVLAGLDLDLLLELVRPLLLWRAKACARALVRAIEQEEFSSTGETSPDRRRRLLRESFALCDGTFVTWGEATAEQHLARAQWQRRNVAACIADAERHEAAAAEITAAGVTCLDDLLEVVA